MAGLKRIGKAFIVGGCVGLVGQVLIALASIWIPDPALVTMAAMLVFGVISVAVIGSGLYAKIAAFGGDGAQIPLCGLMFGAAMTRAMAQRAGASRGKAVLAGFAAIMKVLGTGFVLAFVLGLLLH